MANDTFNGSTPQEAADEIFGVINVASGVAYNSDERTISGVVDDLADDQYLKVGWRGFYTDGIKCDIDSAETRAIASANQYTDDAIANITGLSIEGLSGASGVSYDGTNKMISGRVNNVIQQTEGGYLKVDSGGFFVSGVNRTIEAAKREAISASTAYTDQKITNVNSEINGISNQITAINQNIEAISGDIADTAVTYSRLTVNEQRPILVKKEAGAGTGTGIVQFATGLTVNNAGDLSGHSISAQTVVVTTGITANNLTTTSITYNGTALTEYVTNVVTSTTVGTDENVSQVRYTGTAAKPIITNMNGAENTGAVGFVTAVTVNGNGGLSAVSASINSITSTSITAASLSANNFSATAITYNGQTLDQYISQTADDKNVSQTPFTGTGSAYMVLHTGNSSSTTSVSYVTGVSSDRDGNLKSLSVSAGTITAATDIRGGNISAGTISAATGIRGNNVSANTISAGTSMVTSAMTANTISAGTNSAGTAVTVTGVVEATKFVGIIDCGTYSGASSN